MKTVMKPNLAGIKLKIDNYNGLGIYWNAVEDSI